MTFWAFHRKNSLELCNSYELFASLVARIFCMTRADSLLSLLEAHSITNSTNWAQLEKYLPGTLIHAQMYSSS